MLPVRSGPAVNDPAPHSTRNNLPVQLTPLIGRDQEIAAVKELLLSEGVRLLTLCGPAGIGKTRLSLQVAAELIPHFEDGVYFVPLAPIRHARFVVSAIAQALDLKEVQGQLLDSQLREYLESRRLLLLLDNFEQVIEAVSIITSLLAACPQLKILVTSRSVLRIAGEQQFSVPPLALPNLEQLPDPEVLSQHAAIALFIERARAVNPFFRLTAENAAAIAEICHRLDGLPLAIELATARLKVLSPQALLARLSSRLALLTEGARNLPEHQQTLRKTIDWSYDLMELAERALFSRLGVFAGGCDLEAIEAVCRSSLGGGDEHSSQVSLLNILASLLDKSMLLRDQPARDLAGGEPRFRMLETLREYAIERLAASGELEEIRRRHAAYYLNLAERAEPELVGPKQAIWLARLEEEHDNLRAALQWAIERSEPEMALRLAAALWRFWHVHGHLSDGRRWLETALAQSCSQHTPARVKALCGAGWIECVQGDIEQARRFFEESLELARKLNDRQGIGLALTGVGRMVHLQGDYDRAVALYEESLTLFRALSDSEAMAWTLTRLGILALEQGNHTRAMELFEESLEHFRAVGYRWGITWSLIYLGNAMLEQGNYKGATALFEESLASFRELGDKESMATSLANLGRAAFYQGDVEQAAARYKESLALYQDLGARLGIAECVEVLARAVWAQDQIEQAVQLLASAAALRERIGLPRPPGERARYDRMLAAARARLGQGFEAVWMEGWAISPEQAVARLGSSLTPHKRASGRQQASADQQDDNVAAELTARELEVLRLVATGLTDAQVAKILVLSPRTINAHLRSIYSKLGVSSRSAAIRHAIDHGLI